MATMNGVLPIHESETTLDAISNPKKRKRSGSEDAVDVDLQMLQNRAAIFQNSLRATLNILRSHDTLPSLIRYPLRAKDSDRPEAKRTRLTAQDTSTIEERVLDGTYVSYDDVLEDLENVAALIEEGKDQQVNGDSTYSVAKLIERVSIMRNILNKIVRHQRGAVKEEPAEDIGVGITSAPDHDSREGGLVLTLRTQTDKGPRQLFSGLQRAARLETTTDGGEYTTFDVAAPIDLKKLPNGFDLAEPSPLEAHMKRKEAKPVRTFGEVFKASRNVKALEIPRSSKSGTHGKALDFISDSDAQFAQRAAPIFKNNYAYASLPTGQWLTYKDSDSGSQLSAASRHRRQERTFSFGDHTARPVLDDPLESDLAKTSALFQAAYSSFAPSYDDSSAIVSERTRSEMWWQKGGQRRFQALFLAEYSQDELEKTTSNNFAEDEFADMVANFKPDNKSLDDLAELVDVDTTATDVEDILQEVSDLLQTLSSYQRARDAEQPRNGSTTAPSSAEFDTYEILKSQLSILIQSLPPFAVAKLNGEQLQGLNISTTIMSNGNDYLGSGEADDFTLQRRKAALAATSAAARTPGTIQPASRPGVYQTPATNYTPRPQSYSATQGYGRAAPSQPYHTPRPPSSAAPRPSYPQGQYGSSIPPGYGQQSTTLQQFQRPLPNGYPGYGPTSSQANHVQSPSQPGYQQRAQDNVANTYGRSGSPQKPIMNGHHAQQGTSRQSLGHQQYSASLAAMQQQSEAQRASIERIKAQNQQMQMSQQRQTEATGQRQGSGTPAPQTPGFGRYDGTDERKSSVTLAGAEALNTEETPA